MVRVCCDEVGFTGEDLLNPDQPTFGICSTTLPNDAADAILTGAFPRYQGEEFKASRLWKPGASRARRIESFQQALAPHVDDLFLHAIDKPFTLTAKIHDTFTEPLINAAGLSFYEDGAGLRLANATHGVLLFLGGPALLRAVHEAFAAYARDQAPATLDAFITQLEALARDASEEVVRECLATIVRDARAYAEMGAPAVRGLTDVYVTSAIETVRHWARRSGERVALVHDESTHLLRRTEEWDPFVPADDLGPTVTNHLGQVVTMRLPIESRTAIRSEDSRAVQLCDVVGGLAVRMRRPQGLSEEEGRQLAKGPFGQLLGAGVRFQPELGLEPAAFRPKTGPDVLDLFAHAMAHDMAPKGEHARGARPADPRIGRDRPLTEGSVDGLGLKDEPGEQ